MIGDGAGLNDILDDAKLRIPRQTLDSKIAALGINKTHFKA